MVDKKNDVKFGEKTSCHHMDKNYGEVSALKINWLIVQNNEYAQWKKALSLYRNWNFSSTIFFLVENVEGKRKEHGDSLNCEICPFHFSEELIFLGDFLQYHDHELTLIFGLIYGIDMLKNKSQSSISLCHKKSLDLYLSNDIDVLIFNIIVRSKFHACSLFSFTCI